MPANTAIRHSNAPVSPRPRLAASLAEATRWKPRHLLSSFSDRRSLSKIGGMSAYLSQIRWSLWWGMRH